MTARINVVDSGGTTRQLGRIFVVDSGGTSRLISRIFVVDSGGTSRLVYSRATVVLEPTYLVAHETVSPANPSAGFRLNSDGTISSIVGGVTSTIGAWFSGGAPDKTYDVAAFISSGTFSTGTFGTYQPLSTARSWTKTIATITTQQAVMDIQIRDPDSLAVLATSTVTLEVSKDTL